MTFIIAEAGVNHNGSLIDAIDLINEAKWAKADAVKFQTFEPEELDPPGSRRDMLEQLKLSDLFHLKLKTHAAKIGIEFMSTPFDAASLKFLVKDIGIKRIKIASGHLDNAPLLRAAKDTGLPVLLSTGMAEESMIRRALIHLGSDVTLLHCTSAYPCPDEDVNLRAVVSLRDFGLEVGFSDHSLGITAAIGAVALGATVIEKHLTLDKKALGPDHKASAEPAEFAEMVRHIRRFRKQTGDGIKRIMPSESAALAVAAERKVWREA